MTSPTKQKSLEIRAGADAFLSLLVAIKAKTESDLEEFAEAGGDYADVRDYPALVRTLERDLIANVVEASPAHRQGYLRAIVDLLALEVDGCGISDDWDPLLSSAPAFFAAERSKVSHSQG